MTKRLQVYEADGIVVTFDPNVCIHSGSCLRTLPDVFDIAEARWIRPEKASPEDVAKAVAKCPSGALKVVRAGSTVSGGGAGVEVTVKPNGPLVVRGMIRVTKENGDVIDKETCALCRCGGTANAPFCDGTHNRIAFKSPS